MSDPWKKHHDELRADGFLFCGNGWSLNPGDIVRMPRWRKSPHAGKYGRVVKLHPKRGELGNVTVLFAGEEKSATALPAHVVSCPLRSRLSRPKKGAAA
jgi:hypothetical protein